MMWPSYLFIESMKMELISLSLYQTLEMEDSLFLLGQTDLNLYFYCDGYDSGAVLVEHQGEEKGPLSGPAESSDSRLIFFTVTFSSSCNAGSGCFHLWDPKCHLFSIVHGN